MSITNVGNQPARFQVEIRVPGGPYSIRPRQLAVGETATFNLREMRDHKKPDRTGKTLPSDIDQGQFHWSLVATPGDAHLIGRAEVVSRSARVVSSYSCPVCCPDSGPFGGFDPSGYSLAVDGFAATNSSGQFIDCYFNSYPTNIWWNSLSTWDSSIATFVDGTEDLHGKATGSTYGVGTYDYIYYDNDGMDCYQRNYSNNDYADVAVTMPITFIDVSEVGGTNHTDFIGGIPFASLNITSCGGERFGIKIRFRPTELNTTISDVDSSVSSTGMFALAPSPVDGTYVEFFGNDNPPYTITYLRKVRSEGNRAVTHKVQGTFHDRAFTSQAVVTLVCQ